VQNNGWAISTPRRKQSAAETIAQKAGAFGLPGVQVDGNDVLASYQVVKEAVDRARAGEGATLVELVTYRMQAHTTADDPKRYVPAAELEQWRAKDPIARFRRFLMDRSLLTEAAEAGMEEEISQEINRNVEQLEAMAPTPPDRIFELVYQEMTPQLRQQQAELLQYLKEVR
jgi:pyruvate dehydrogenase E1 component alpha subunit